ncbi:hypothetical protein [Flavobacterium sp. ENC]|uniref:hypothetical protein n=1 Tax=Flavobacterium sp. ENC TaxID=2897330 RepID=UPI001E307BE3|nr:hypothetical protein [Flavobacterium sp. ENC]MCD0467240.1 hypothetical protein [Flavobacterium sp. ENC]
MKIICVILLIVLAISCKKYVINDDLTFVPEKSMTIKNITLLKKDAVCIGSYTLGSDTVVSQFKIQSKYSLITIKLRNVSSAFTFKNHEKADCPTPGYFSIVDEGLFEVKMSPKIFDVKEKINSIDFFSDTKINYQINNDSIKNFTVNFKKFVLKINNDDNKILYSTIEYYGLKNLDAEIVSFKYENQIYLFIMTPVKENIILEKDFLRNYLFN